MKQEIEDVRAGLKSVFDFLSASDLHDQDRAVWGSESRLDVLSAEITRYMPELAELLARTGRNILSGQIQKTTSSAIQQGVTANADQTPPLGARAMIGFALNGGRTPRATADWMKELREGDAD
ncbi:hypothetical protein SAMN02745166_03649 [Prosthecobacter debontii]|uniref:Uncharacterized protein n=1 Tax=Prosthecobacter debontii TaxID=48467 RepID=A0A1T4YLJ5_9BACT|nr:hypothetical protein [Prosthecobacter debontii]SKB02438.1 hypothetical protein SAMN02745166_03649 [Prosthecobacter debontii]